MPSPPAPLPEGEGSLAPTWLGRVLWVLLPACASVVLLATTNHVCQDVAPRPFLWVVPLSLYLLTFIVCFDHSRWYVRPLWALPAIIGIAWVMGGHSLLSHIMWTYQGHGLPLDFTQQLVIHFSTMFCICMVCHGELVRLKPHPRHLTEFYLLMSAGGGAGRRAGGPGGPARLQHLPGVGPGHDGVVRRRRRGPVPGHIENALGQTIGAACQRMRRGRVHRLAALASRLDRD